MKTVALVLFSSILLFGCKDDNTRTQSIPEPSYSASTASQWLQTCVNELADNRSGESQWFTGIGANDVSYMTGKNVLEDIFQTCQKISPLSEENLPIYKSWLKNRISDIQALSIGTPRTHVDQVLIQNGGLSTLNSAIYSHKECRVLKVRIEFDNNSNIKATSTPYLGLFTTD